MTGYLIAMALEFENLYTFLRKVNRAFLSLNGAIINSLTIDMERTLNPWIPGQARNDERYFPQILHPSPT